LVTELNTLVPEKLRARKARRLGRRSEG